VYYTNRRTSDRIYFAGSGVRGGTPVNYGYSTPCLLEGIYSWRTGRGNVSDAAISPPTRVHDGWGIQAPSNRGSIGDRLSSRAQYLTEVSRAAFPAETSTGLQSTNRVSTSDSGHLFASHKTLRKPFIAHNSFYQSASSNFDGDMWGSVGAGLYNPSPYSFGFPNENRVNALGVSNTNRQGMANRYFAATAPDRQIGTLGVTIIELLRGDIPSVLKNFHLMMSGLQKVRHQLGSDYLNIVFGWTPLIQEYANVIKVGMTLERAVYYESYRRKRAWEGPNMRESDPIKNVILTSASQVNGQSTLPEPGEVVPPSVGFGGSYTTTSTRTVVEDYRFSSRYTGLARASRKAETQSEIALDIITRLGLVDDPTMLWDLTPYSWLVDWFTTMGDSITNADLYSPLRGKYNVDFAYLTTKYTETWNGSLVRATHTLLPGQVISVQRPTSMVTSVTKWRDRATPFGFGTQLGSLSSSQFAILVALGLAKSR